MNTYVALPMNVIVPTDAKAKPNWKCNELFTVSNKPLCPAPNPPIDVKKQNLYFIFIIKFFFILQINLLNY